MDYRVFNAVRDDEELGMAEAMVLLVYASYANRQKGTIWPSAQTVAKGAKCSERHVRSVTGKLVEKGYLIQVKSSAGRSTNVFRLGDRILNHEDISGLEPSTLNTFQGSNREHSSGTLNETTLNPEHSSANHEHSSGDLIEKDRRRKRDSLRSSLGSDDPGESESESEAEQNSVPLSKSGRPLTPDQNRVRIIAEKFEQITGVEANVRMVPKWISLLGGGDEGTGNVMMMLMDFEHEGRMLGLDDANRWMMAAVNREAQEETE